MFCALIVGPPFALNRMRRSIYCRRGGRRYDGTDSVEVSWRWFERLLKGVWEVFGCTWDDHDRKPEAVCGISLDMGEYNE